MGIQFMSMIVIQFIQKMETFQNVHTDVQKKKEWESFVNGYILALELAGKNKEANECKRIYEDLKSQ